MYINCCKDATALIELMPLVFEAVAYMNTKLRIHHGHFTLDNVLLTSTDVPLIHNFSHSVSYMDPYKGGLDVEMFLIDINAAIKGKEGEEWEKLREKFKASGKHTCLSTILESWRKL